MWVYNNTLSHSGRLGMKWGKHIFETENLQKYKGKTDHTSAIVKSSKDINDNVENIRKSTKKGPDLSKMTDEQLRARVNRMNMEQQYSNLDAQRASKGHASVDRILNVAGSSVAIAAGTVAIALSIKQLLAKAG